MLARAVEEVVTGPVAQQARLEERPRESTLKTTPGKAMPPQNGLGTSVRPKTWISSGGMSRSAPMSQPRYQSGWAPLVARAEARRGPTARPG